VLVTIKVDTLTLISVDTLVLKIVVAIVVSTETTVVSVTKFVSVTSASEVTSVAISVSVVKSVKVAVLPAMVIVLVTAGAQQHFAEMYEHPGQHFWPRRHVFLLVRSSRSIAKTRVKTNARRKNRLGFIVSALQGLARHSV
jgi:molybdenum cofactor biosynthesis enzyme MoaA